MNYISLLESTYNTRDLGGIAAADDKITRYNVFWRSDVPIHPTAADINIMRKNNITTVVDFRRDDETAAMPNGFGAKEGFVYYSIPVSEGSEVPKTPQEVAPSYLRIADAAKAMKKAFSIFAETESGILFNCHSGKDRTGVVAAILLMLAGVDKKDIVDNYMLSKMYLRGSFKALLLRRPEMDMKVILPSETFISEFMALFESKYGSAEKYLRKIGVTDKNIAALKSKFTVHAQELERQKAEEPLFKGVIIKESLGDEDILGSVRIDNVELWKSGGMPKYWTAVYFSAFSEDFPQKLSEAISEQGTWYCDFKRDNTKYIILHRKVLEYEIGNARQRAAVCAECRKSGIPESQMDWSES